MEAAPPAAAAVEEGKAPAAAPAEAMLAQWAATETIAFREALAQRGDAARVPMASSTRITAGDCAAAAAAATAAAAGRLRAGRGGGGAGRAVVLLRVRLRRGRVHVLVLAQRAVFLHNYEFSLAELAEAAAGEGVEKGERERVCKKERRKEEAPAVGAPHQFLIRKTPQKSLEKPAVGDPGPQKKSLI